MPLAQGGINQDICEPQYPELPLKVCATSCNATTLAHRTEKKEDSVAHRCLMSLLSQAGSGSDTKTGTGGSSTSDGAPSSGTAAPPADMLAIRTLSRAMPGDARARDTWTHHTHSMSEQPREGCKEVGGGCIGAQEG